MRLFRSEVYTENNKNYKWGLEITQNCREYFELENLFYLVNDDLNIHEFIFPPIRLESEEK